MIRSTLGKYVLKRPLSRLIKEYPEIAACAPIKKSGSTLVLVPLRLLYCRKALPAKNKASLGIGLFAKLKC